MWQDLVNAESKDSRQKLQEKLAGGVESALPPDVDADFAWQTPCLMWRLRFVPLENLRPHFGQSSRLVAASSADKRSEAV